LDEGAFSDCLSGPARVKIRDDLAEAQRLGLNSTPSFILGVAQPDGRVLIATKIRGAQPYEVFEKALKSSL
jgi:predicted DsbA family dithiol-disulfide isomerase